MKTIKQLGIWMDHSHAILMELSGDIIRENSFISEFTQAEKEISLEKNEKFMHNKEQHLQASFFKKNKRSHSGISGSSAFWPYRCKKTSY